MALQPVSGVTPLSTAKVSFSGRRNNNNESPSLYQRIPAQVKAVPVVVLMAMSPLNKINATEPMEPQHVVTELIQSNPLPEKQPKIIQHFDLGERGKACYGINKLSLDDDDNTYEAIELVKYSNANKDVMRRMIITNAAILKNAANEESLTMAGVPLSDEFTDDYTPENSIARETKSPGNNGAAMDILISFLKVFDNDKKYNNGAFKLGTLQDCLSAKEVRTMRMKLRSFMESE